MTRRIVTYLRNNVLALLAIFIALGAGSFAVAALKKNSVKSKQIKDGQVKNQDIAASAVSADKLAPGAVGGQEIAPGAVGGQEIVNGSITGAQIADGSLNGAQIADNSLTGADVDETTLQGVNAATVGGLRVEKVNFQVLAGNGGPVLILGGLRIDAACASSGDGLDINASTSKNDAHITLTSMEAVDANDTTGARDIDSGGEDHFDVGDTFQIDNTLPFGGDFGAHFTLNYTAPDGSIVVANLYTYENPNFACKLTGIAIGA